MIVFQCLYILFFFYLLNRTAGSFVPFQFDHKIGTCAAFIGKDDMAADHLEKALQLCDENGILDRGYIYVDLCIIYYRMKQNDKAIFCGKEAKKFAANFKDTAFDEYVHNFRRKTEHLISQPN